jgi:hypothetical protein
MNTNRHESKGGKGGDNDLYYVCTTFVSIRVHSWLTGFLYNRNPGIENLA